uniref:Uncharacterized protein n=2 Tax=Corvus TaxID=30420 RepID=A0A8C3H2H0_CORMO
DAGVSPADRSRCALSTALYAELVSAGLAPPPRSGAAPPWERGCTALGEAADGRDREKGGGMEGGGGEKHFPPRDNELGRPARKCHTSGMLTPNGKEYAQKIPREELTHLILKLLQAWKEPLSHFNQHIEHHQELPDDSLSKAKQISNMVHELQTGVEKVTEKMQSMGIISNSLNGMASSEGTALSISNEANMMSDSDFIHCFRRDSNKVQSYLKILKCRIMPENSC